MTRSLVVHIGTGKTGSTAIQGYLKRRKDDFVAKGVQYWGLNLEHSATEQRYCWQQPSGIGLLQRMSAELAKEELSNTLEEALSQLEAGGVAIWSNESIYEMPNVYIPILQEIASKGKCKIIPIAYARNMRSYIISAYKQWGIKHKTYPGRILGFADWVKANHDFLSYGKKLNEWDQAFSGMARIFNYDSIGDVLLHFVTQLPNCESLVPQCGEGKENTTPDWHQLAFHALYSNQFSEPVLPDKISSLLRRYNLDTKQFQMVSFSSLCPSANELEFAELLLQDDIIAINQIMENHGQDPLHFRQDQGSNNSPTEQEVTRGILSLLLGIIIHQEERIDGLERGL